MEINEIVANNIKIVRNHYGYSLAQVSIRTGIEKTRLSRMENNTAKIPVDFLQKLSVFYGVNIIMFFILVNDDNYYGYVDLVERKVDFNIDISLIYKLINN